MSKELKTGIVAIVIITLGIWGYNFLKGQNLFNPGSRKFYVEYENVEGLTPASLVTINGLQVGKINTIVFNSDPNKKGRIVVEIILNNKFQFTKNSIARIYSAGLMGGQNIAIVPNNEGELAVSGDYLKGEVQSGLLSSLGNKLTPIQAKLEKVLVNADSLTGGVNEVLGKASRKSLNNSILGLEGIISELQKTLGGINLLLNNNQASIKATLSNAEKITDDFSKISKDLTQADLGGMVKKLETTLANVNNLLANIENGKGTLGKLMNDDKMYTNLTNASKEMEVLLREFKLNPKRFLHFSLFGKKAKPFNEENNENNISNK